MTQTTAEQRKRAELLLENTKRLRFFKGQVYDGGADEYLRQLHSFLADFLSSPSPSVTEEEIAEAICCPGGCLRKPDADCWAGRNREEREQTSAVMALIRG